MADGSSNYDKAPVVVVPPTKELPASDVLTPLWENFDPSGRLEGELKKEERMGPYRVGVGKDKGEIRDNNQDNCTATRIVIDREAGKTYADGQTHIEENMLIVADGIGGMNNGAEASATAMAECQTAYQKFRKEGYKIKDALAKAIHEANKVLYMNNQQGLNIAKMGSTISIAVLGDNGNYVYAHIGDSRGYKITDQKMEMVGRDHALGGNQQNTLTRGLGVNAEVKVDDSIHEGKLQNGEQFLLCSDGLWNMVKTQDIKKVARSSENQEEAARRLLAKANEAGGKDNIAVVIARKEAQAAKPEAGASEKASLAGNKDFPELFGRLEQKKVLNGVDAAALKQVITQFVAGNADLLSIIPQEEGLRAEVVRLKNDLTAEQKVREQLKKAA